MSAGHVYILLHQREKRGSTIQYSYRKRGTHARVFSQTLTHVNSKNEIRQWDRRRRKKRGVIMEKSTAGTNKRSPNGLSKHNINKHNTVLFYKKWKKYNEIQLTKNKMDSSKWNDKSSTIPSVSLSSPHPPSPVSPYQVLIHHHPPSPVSLYQVLIHHPKCLLIKSSSTIIHHPQCLLIKSSY